MENIELEKLKEENEALRSLLESISAYEKEQHDFSLKLAKDIVNRDSKPIANIILNMYFGNGHSVSFCEIFDLREMGSCIKNERCTDCIHTFLQKHFGGEN